MKIIIGICAAGWVCVAIVFIFILVIMPLSWCFGFEQEIYWLLKTIQPQHIKFTIGIALLWLLCCLVGGSDIFESRY